MEFKLYLRLLFFSLITLGFVSCGSDDDPDNDEDPLLPEAQIEITFGGNEESFQADPEVFIQNFSAGGVSVYRMFITGETLSNRLFQLELQSLKERYFPSRSSYGERQSCETNEDEQTFCEYAQLDFEVNGQGHYSDLADGRIEATIESIDRNNRIISLSFEAVLYDQTGDDSLNAGGILQNLRYEYRD